MPCRGVAAGRGDLSRTGQLGSGEGGSEEETWGAANSIWQKPCGVSPTRKHSRGPLSRLSRVGYTDLLLIPTTNDKFLVSLCLGGGGRGRAVPGPRSSGLASCHESQHVAQGRLSWDLGAPLLSFCPSGSSCGMQGLLLGEKPQKNKSPWVLPRSEQSQALGLPMHLRSMP